MPRTVTMNVWDTAYVLVVTSWGYWYISRYCCKGGGLIGATDQVWDHKRRVLPAYHRTLRQAVTDMVRKNRRTIRAMVDRHGGVTYRRTDE